MEPYQAVAVAVMIAMGFVVNSTMKLNKLREKIGVERTMVNLRALRLAWGRFRIKSPSRSSALSKRRAEAGGECPTSIVSRAIA